MLFGRNFTLDDCIFEQLSIDFWCDFFWIIILLMVSSCFELKIHPLALHHMDTVSVIQYDLTLVSFLACYPLKQTFIYLVFHL